ncbi:MAG: hypothetical protein NC937_00295 [Candidatus Omnitrophica bacterium]|nr:hypothetical protein [Candidatus Omnitrophota bacterium]MCM8824580.1 hypothetical protein [Candidatus Omnitrophota bacterium]
MKRNSKKREYWTQQMEKGYRFMQKIMCYPVKENMEKLVDLQQAVKKSGVYVKFSSVARSTVSKPIFRIREGIVDSFLAAAEKMNKNGFLIKVEDAFRTRQMQNPLNRPQKVFDAIMKIILWECNGKIPEPDFIFKRISVLIATIPKIGTHMSGSAIDITILSMKTGKEIDRGEKYLAMNEKTFMNSIFISKKAKKYRHRFNQIMKKNGFYAYPFEFWHYSKGDAFAHYLTKSRKPAIYGPVDMIDDEGNVSPIRNLTEPLFPLDELRKRLYESLKR